MTLCHNKSVCYAIMSQLKIPQNNQQTINQHFKIKFIFLGKLIAIPRIVN